MPRRVTARALIAVVATLLMALSPAVAGAASVVVAPGETLGAVAARHGVSVSALAAANGIADPDRVTAGRRLRVPGTAAPPSPSAASGGGYRVRAGDTLGTVAARLGTSADALARLNGLADPDRLSIGQLLRTGSGAPAPASGATAGRVVVHAGDTLGAIAARLGTSAEALARTNGIADPDRIAVGQVLSTSGAAPPASSAPVVGSGGRVTVRSGETLDAIAQRHGTSAEALARLNGISDPNLVAAGRSLLVPGAGTPAAASPAPVSAGRTEVAALLDRSAARHGVSPGLARAIAWQESGWSQAALSSVGAIGVMQLMPDTARWFGPAVLGRPIDPHSVSENVEGGVAYLAWLRQQSGSDRIAVASYYQGLTSVRRNGLFGETEAYVASVFALVGRV